MRFLRAVAAVLLALAHGAAAASYDRKVRIDWAPIEGAGRYEVQWTKAAGGSCAPDAMDADAAAAVEEVAAPVWQKSLPGGGYCVRVRGIGVGERPGQWTDPQLLPVKPKPPGGVQWEEAGRVTWEKVPYATGYEVEVRDSSGRTAYRAEVEGSELQVPSDVFTREKLGESFTVRVSTVAEGAPASSPAVRGLSADEAWGLARAGGAVGLPKPRVRALPPQPQASALSPEEVEERFTLAGEVPLPPSRDDWARARTPTQIANLRKRTIASARLEIIRELDADREPDLRLKGGIFYGGLTMTGNSYDEAGRSETSHDSVGAEYQLSAVLAQDRPWGAELGFRTTPADYAIGRETDLSFASAMVTRNFGLDPYWQSVLSFRFGAMFYVIPYVQFASDSELPVSIDGIAFGAGVGYRVALDDRWGAGARFDVFRGPRQGVFGGLGSLPAAADGLSGEISAVLSVSPELEVEAGLSGSRSEVETTLDGGSIGSEWVALGGFVRGVYRTPAGERRGPASLSSVDLSRSLGEARVSIPVALRSQVIFTSESVPTTAKGTEAGGALRLGLRFGRGSPFLLRGDLDSISGSSFHWAARVGYEARLLGRDDTRAALLAGPGLRRDRDSGNPSLGDVSARILAIEPGIRLWRGISDSLSAETEFSVGLPLTVSSGSGGGGAGTSRYWSFELALGHRIGGDLTLWTGYAHRNAQYSTAPSGASDTAGPMNLTRNEDQARLGVSWGF